MKTNASAEVKKITPEIATECPASGSVTVVYDIKDEAAWRDGGNPLRWEHHGLKAHTVATYDAVERYQLCREALERISLPSWAYDEAAKIARTTLKSLTP